MNLDDLQAAAALDAQGMAAHIDGLPQQLQAAWQLAQRLPLPAAAGVQNIVICGMGGSAIGGALLQSLVAEQCTLPIFSVRDYQLPAFVGPNSLVVCASHSGNTEETLAAFEAAHACGAKLIVISTGGQLAQRAAQTGCTYWPFAYASQPRAALGYALMLPLGLLARLGFIPDPTALVEEAVAALLAQQPALCRESPAVANPAKRLAGQMVDRKVLLFAAEPLTAVARRWRGQIAENAKASAQTDELPEMNHNAIAGIERPEALITRSFVLFLNSTLYHPRNAARLQWTHAHFMQSGYNCDAVAAAGSGRLAQMLSVLHFGDYVSYYLAIANGVDPTPIDVLLRLKAHMAQT